MKYFSLILLLLTVCSTSNAQTQTCVEPARIQPTYQCNERFYDPVCGCNNVTYRNQCTAYNVYGVNWWRSGVCSGLDVDLFPNPVVYGTALKVNLSYPEFIIGNADVKIVDMYGKVWEQRLINSFNRINLEFDVTVMRTGVYLLVVQSSLGTYVAKRFSKY
ncbi:MAG: T9SS type A sorting domain-containing protein [Bacteroidota bacterium]